jgi:hypothetical protein
MSGGRTWLLDHQVEPEVIGKPRSSLTRPYEGFDRETCIFENSQRETTANVSAGVNGHRDAHLALDVT